MLVSTDNSVRPSDTINKENKDKRSQARRIEDKEGKGKKSEARRIEGVEEEGEEHDATVAVSSQVPAVADEEGAEL